MDSYANLLHAFGQDLFIQATQAGGGSGGADVWYKAVSDVTHNDMTYYFKELLQQNISENILSEYNEKAYPMFVPVSCIFQTGRSYYIQTKHDNQNGVEIIPSRSHSELERTNERQVCEIEETILPNLVLKGVGIIAPYNNQVNLIKKRLKYECIKVETVHKFQGQENDVIILSTVSDKVKISEDDEFNDFMNDPKLLNVAISRAKKKLILIISEELMGQDGSILSDFSKYINYFTESAKIIESKVYSVFDLMYRDYSSVLEPLRAKLIKVSEFKSENIIATLIKDCIDKKYKTLNFLHNYPLRKIINVNSLLDERDRKFVSNENTHCDFVIYNQFGKKPCFVIEVDGKQHRKKVQQERDRRKDRLLNDVGIPIYRIPTTSVVKLDDIEKIFSF